MPRGDREGQAGRRLAGLLKAVLQCRPQIVVVEPQPGEPLHLPWAEPLVPGPRGKAEAVVAMPAAQHGQLPRLGQAFQPVLPHALQHPVVGPAVVLPVDQHRLLHQPVEDVE